MPHAIDHLVIAVPDPDAGARQLEDHLGIAFTSGGSHPGAGTYNRIAFLGEPYIELIGVIDPAAAQRSPIGAAALRTLRAQPAGGLATYALADDDLETTITGLQAAGSSISPPRHGSRQRDDGELVEWWTATFAELGPDHPPFVIRHARTGLEWSDEAVARRRQTMQPAGCVAILRGLVLRTPDAPGVGERYRAELGLPLDEVGDDRVVVLGPHTIRLGPGSPDAPRAEIVITCPDQADLVVDQFGIRFDRRSTTS